MSKELNKLIANALSKHSSKSVEIAAKSKPFIGKVKDMHYFINVDGINNNFVSEPFGRQIDSLKKIEAFKKSAKSAYISIKRTPIAKAFKEFKDLYKPIEFFGATKINDSFKDDSFKIWYTTSEEVASTEIATPNKPKPKGPGRLGKVKPTSSKTVDIRGKVNKKPTSKNLYGDWTSSKIEKTVLGVTDELVASVKSMSLKTNILNFLYGLYKLDVSIIMEYDRDNVTKIVFKNKDIKSIYSYLLEDE